MGQFVFGSNGTKTADQLQASDLEFAPNNVSAIQAPLLLAARGELLRKMRELYVEAKGNLSSVNMLVRESDEFKELIGTWNQIAAITPQKGTSDGLAAADLQVIIQAIINPQPVLDRVNAAARSSSGVGTV